MKESQTNPAYYSKITPQPIEAIEGWGLNFHLGNAVKYIARAGKKDKESEKLDLLKAIWYLQRAVSNIEKKKCV
jgi:hypothetical protein